MRSAGYDAPGLPVSGRLNRAESDFRKLDPGLNAAGRVQPVAFKRSHDEIDPLFAILALSSKEGGKRQPLICWTED